MGRNVFYRTISKLIQCSLKEVSDKLIIGFTLTLMLVFNASANTVASTDKNADQVATIEVADEEVADEEVNKETINNTSEEISENIVATNTLDPVSIEYKIRISKFGNATLGKVQSVLETTDTGYSIKSVTKAQGMALLLMQSNIQESCEFEVINGRAVARNYSGGTVKKQEYSVAYDWDNRKVNLSDEESLDMPQGYVVDNCIMWFAAALLKGQIAKNEGVYVVDGKSKRIRGYKLRSQDTEIISTALGDRKTLKMVLERELRPDRTLTFWLSTDDQYLPVRIEESRKSRTTTFEISELKKA